MRPLFIDVASRMVRLPAGRCDSDARRKANTASVWRFCTFWFGLYVAAWILLVCLLCMDGVVKSDAASFDPFEILGVAVGLSPGQLRS
jgi:preprotein translocase subunit Sec63